ncbi:MAG: 3-oxoacyl-ACP synthase, partial [Armatimonadota bacterium]|nr:3-oxoacyl-ACP synthase [Armatimonadota bacterium]
MQAAVKAIEYYLPERVLTNSQLAAEFPEWTVEKIEEKTGIVDRHIAAAEECSSDLAIAAARKLFASGACQPEEIDYLLLCTQSPDYFLPTTACLVQHSLGIPTTAGALDFNLGCSGYVYGLSLAKGLIDSGQAR